jgi:hypothetical protein
VRGLAAALAAQAALLFARTLVFSFASAGEGAVRAFAFVAAAVDLLLAVSLVRAAKHETLAGFAALLAGAQVLSDLLGLAGQKDLVYELAGSEPTFTLLLWVLLFFVAEKATRASGARRPLSIAAGALLLAAFAWRVHRMESHGGRSPTVVWLSWATELTLLSSLAAMAFVASAPERFASRTTTSAGPYREPEPMPPPSVAPAWSSVARALLGYRRVELARVGAPVACVMVWLLAAALRSDSLGVAGLLLLASGRALTAMLLAASAIDARAVAPAPARAALRWTTVLLALSGLCDLFAVFAALGHRRREDLLFFSFVASFVLGLLALGMSARVLGAICRAFERLGDLERAKRVTGLAVVAAVLPPFAFGVTLMQGGGQDLVWLVVVACFAAFVAWCFALFLQMRLIGQLAQPRS